MMSTSHEDSHKNSGSATGSARQAAREAGREAKAEGQRLRDEAVEGVRRRADERKHAAGAYLHTVASAVGSSAEAFRRDGLTGAGAMLDSAASELDSFADRVAERPADQILRDVEGFARRHPAVFFGSAFLLAFGATRLLKSSAPTDNSDYYDKVSAGSGASATGTSPGAATAVASAPSNPADGATAKEVM